MAGSLHLAECPQEPLLVEPSQHSDAERLARRGLRVADMAELRALLGVDDPTYDYDVAYESLLAGFYYGSWTVWFRGEPCAMFGSAALPGGGSVRSGAIWMLGHDDLICKESRKQFIRESPAWFRITTEPYDLCTNIVHSGNHVHLRWLRWLGCKFIDSQTINNHTFYEFVYVHYSGNDCPLSGGLGGWDTSGPG